MPIPHLSKERVWDIRDLCVDTMLRLLQAVSSWLRGQA